MRVEFKRVLQGRRGKAASGVAVLLILILASSAVGEAQRWGGSGGPGGRDGRGGRGEARLLPLRQLDLSDEQREQVREAVGESREAGRDTARAMRDARRSLAEAVTAQPVDEDRIRSLAADLGRLQGDAALGRANLHAALWGLLTPEQQARATEIRAARQERRADRRERLLERLQERVQDLAR